MTSTAHVISFEPDIMENITDSVLIAYDGDDQMVVFFVFVLFFPFHSMFFGIRHQYTTVKTCTFFVPIEPLLYNSLLLSLSTFLVC